MVTYYTKGTTMIDNVEGFTGCTDVTKVSTFTTVGLGIRPALSFLGVF